MRRKVILFLKLAERLFSELDNQADLFIQERPFLIDPNFPLEVLELSEQKKKIQIRINAILKEFVKIRL